jgi:hypothetical protein
MSFFAVDFEAEMPYPLAPAQAGEVQDRSWKQAASKWQLAISQT